MDKSTSINKRVQYQIKFYFIQQIIIIKDKRLASFVLS